MNPFKKVLQFLFGKDADIFDQNGQVQHQMPEKKWKDWNARYTTTSEYNWRNHSGNKRQGIRNKT